MRRRGDVREEDVVGVRGVVDHRQRPVQRAKLAGSADDVATPAERRDAVGDEEESRIRRRLGHPFSDVREERRVVRRSDRLEAVDGLARLSDRGVE